jgi:hypothetical protein
MRTASQANGGLARTFRAVSRLCFATMLELEVEADLLRVMAEGVKRFL